MTYPYVQAANDYGPRKGPVRAFLVHMAEGGGTVGFLSRHNPRGVSVHYVIEYSGRIVQMLAESHASGSLNPNNIRTDDGPEPYGASVAKAVMGSWWHDPNSAVISVELEGFEQKGPNIDQRNSLASLVADVRSRYPQMGLLGHRDFTNEKQCPGPYIPWPKLGGHGPYHPVPAPSYRIRIDPRATVRAYVLKRPKTGSTYCIESWTDTVWGPVGSSAAASAPVHRFTCDGSSAALTTLVTSGTYKGQHLRVGHGVTLEEN